jgi:glycerol-3-phosphate acyltransferase PlsY
MTIAILLLLAYLIGGIPFGYLMVRLKTGKDVRSLGSGNIGATNVLRTTGRAAGIVTLLLDVAKGYLAVFLMARFTDQHPLWCALAGVAVVMGHAFPVFLKFQGGKAVASFVGVALALFPAALGAVVVLFVAVVAVTRYISLGSMLGAGLFPFAVWLLYHPTWPVVACMVFCGGFIVWRHRANIGRLRAGTENVFSFGGRKR